MNLPVASSSRDSGSAPAPQDDAREPLTVVSGEPDGFFLVPDLSRVLTPADLRRRARRRAGGRVHVPALLAVIALSGVAAAGAVEAAWSARAVRAHSPAAPAQKPAVAPAAASQHAPLASPSPASQPAPATSAPAASAPVSTGHATDAHRGALALAAPASRADASGPSCALRCGTNLACIMRCPYDGLAAGHGVVNPTPTRDQVLTAVRGVRGAVMLCGLGVEGIAPVANVTIAFDSSGAADSARVAGPLAHTAAGDCVERAVRRARVPRFSDASFRVTYPFTVQ